ncbi:hypothetical protein OF83DRAFT_1172288 [Amylostereum chailletii]|nr:hypothetical protein OF83DRAFT_1172288 [Amylostereum chailletii]
MPPCSIMCTVTCENSKNTKNAQLLKHRQTKHYYPSNPHLLHRKPVNFMPAPLLIEYPTLHALEESHRMNAKSRERRQLRNAVPEHCWNCGKFHCLSEIRSCSGCKSPKGRYCDDVCQRNHWPLHKDLCISIRSASREARTTIHLVDRALAIDEVIVRLSLIAIHELSLLISPSSGDRYAVKVVCGLSSTCWESERYRPGDQGPTPVKERCLTFLNFSRVLMQSVPYNCHPVLRLAHKNPQPQRTAHQRLCVDRHGNRITDRETPIASYWFVVEESGNQRSSPQALLDLSFFMSAAVSPEAMDRAAKRRHEIKDRLVDEHRNALNRHILEDRENTLRLRALLGPGA